MAKVIFISSDIKEVEMASKWAEASGYPLEHYSEQEWEDRTQEYTEEESIDSHTLPDNVVPFVDKNQLPAGTIRVPPRQKSLQEMETETITKTLKIVKGNISRASRLLGVGRATLYRKIRENHIDLDCLKTDFDKIKKVA